MSVISTYYIVQNGRVLSRKCEKSYEIADAIYNITSVDAHLSCVVNTTAPFDGILDEAGTFWQLPDYSVVYDSASVVLNLAELYEAKNMVITPAVVQVTIDGSVKSLTRDRASDSAHGVAWKDETITIWTDRLVPDGTTFWTDSGLSVIGGTVTMYVPPTVQNYPGGWKALFSITPAQLAFSIVATGIYGENS